MIGQSMRASDIPLLRLDAAGQPGRPVIAHVVAIKAEAAAEPAAEVAVAAGAEPEVIKKGKKEEEGAAESKETKKKK